MRHIFTFLSLTALVLAVVFSVLGFQWRQFTIEEIQSLIVKVEKLENDLEEDRDHCSEVNQLTQQLIEAQGDVSRKMILTNHPEMKKLLPRSFFERFER